MCLAASLVILVVLALRPLLKNIPKNLMWVLWLAVLFRLLCPVTVAGPLPGLWYSEQPESGEVQPRPVVVFDRISETAMAERLPIGAGDGLQGPEGSHGVNDQNAGGNPSDGGNNSNSSNGSNSNDGNSSNSSDGDGSNGSGGYGNAGRDTDRDGVGTEAVRDWFAALSVKEWAIFSGGVAALAGSIFFLIRNARRFHKTAKEIRTAEAAEPGTRQRIWGRTMTVLECEGMNSPMVFGMIRPRICLPCGFAEQVSAREYDLILKHEGAHIRRGDCLLKYLFRTALSIHWWNPLTYISVKLLQKDMEMACDEYVVAHSDEDVRKEYATLLLRFSMAQSGMVFPAAFGESSTEGRVKNILKYKKLPLICTLSLLGIVGALMVCLVTNPHNRKADVTAADDGAGLLSDEDSGGENSEREDFGSGNAGDGHAGGSEADRLVFSSDEEVLSYYRERWQQKLTAEADSADARRIIVRQVSRTIGFRSQDSDHFFRDKLCYYVMDPVTGIPTSYYTYLTYEEREGKIYVYDSEDEAFEHVTTGEQAKRLLVWGFGNFSNVMPEDVLEEGTNFAGHIVEKAMLSSGNWQFDLERPETAIPLLLHLEGGSGEFQRDAGEPGISGYLTYTFGDGSSVCYGVSNREAVSNNRYCSDMEAYFPTFCYWDTATAEKLVEAARQAEVYLQGATARDFRTADQRFDPLYSHVWDVVMPAQSSIKPVCLAMIQERDVALYGLSGVQTMVLRDGEQFYPVYLKWQSPQMHSPKIHMGDYDGDGEDEYAIITLTGTGTGVSIEQLYILEKNPSEGSLKELSVCEFDRYMQEEQFSRVSYDWDPERQTLHMRVDGESTGLFGSLGEWLEPIEEALTFQDFTFGNFISFTEENGQLYFQAPGGIVLKERGWGLVEYRVTLTAPIVYSEGTFSLGEITLTKSVSL